jgi:hypothetical protein
MNANSPEIPQNNVCMCVCMCTCAFLLSATLSTTGNYITSLGQDQGLLLEAVAVNILARARGPVVARHKPVSGAKICIS